MPNGSWACYEAIRLGISLHRVFERLKNAIEGGKGRRDERMERGGEEEIPSLGVPCACLVQSVSRDWQAGNFKEAGGYDLQRFPRGDLP